MNSIHWHTKAFEELTLDELYDIMQLRINIFVVEQNCPYPELDGKDKNCLHVFATQGGKVVAYARIVPPGLSYKEISIGRVVVHADYRKDGLGRILIDLTLEKIEEEFSVQPIQIGAQTYLKKFYSSFGFEPVSEEYLEDGIPHVDMIRKG
ncbi:GNAT family N-acetyltransferase [Myroides sp. 1354]|uniref:GNAT family N-acetyltransferase n=1 Tax=unclassified Myroides TaxID=2642485 RepID=UPI0025749401|nr:MULTISPECIES: GNAT family N-acetyltransferase [unclassified Myroides]MDM1045037.1 GNAT family N-acetyltransferase [Myroides sp. R163-1]MDM1055919.1 GNAT family N-acetyltransferase [Myroides sp. 1354]MDM1069132.1 GNAT family N-acetyltransferase [Myroides sp. 1372]